MTTTEPWERQANETPQAWEGFTTYRDMGLTRSTPKVARELGKSETLIGRWCTAHKWVERCAAYDREQDRQWRAQIQEQGRQAIVGQMAAARLLRSKAGQALMSLDADDMTTSEAIRGLETASKIEHTIFGIAQVVEVSGPDGGPIQISDDQLRAEVLALLAGEEDTDGAVPDGDTPPPPPT